MVALKVMTESIILMVMMMMVVATSAQRQPQRRLLRLTAAAAADDIGTTTRQQQHQLLLEHEEEDEFESMFADTSFRIARPEVHAMAVAGKKRSATTTTTSQKQVDTGKGTSPVESTTDNTDAHRDNEGDEVDTKALATSTTGGDEYAQASADITKDESDRVSDAAEKTTEEITDDKVAAANEEQSTACAFIDADGIHGAALPSEMDDRKFPIGDDASFDRSLRAANTAAAGVGRKENSPAASLSACPPLRLDEANHDVGGEYPENAYSKLNQKVEEVAHDEPSPCEATRSQTFEIDAGATKQRTGSIVPDAAVDTISENESTTMKENDVLDPREAILEVLALEPTFCTSSRSNGSTKQKLELTTIHDVVVQGCLSHRSDDAQSQSVVLQESCGLLNTSSGGPGEAATSCEDTQHGVVERKSESESLGKRPGSDPTNEENTIEMEESQNSSVEDHSYECPATELLASRPSSVDSTVPPSTVEAPPQLSRHPPLIAQGSALQRSQGAEQESHHKGQHVANNESSSPSQLSHQSSSSYGGGFQLMTQAVPTFEYGYALTQQQDDLYEAPPPHPNAPSEASVGGAAKPLESLSSVGALDISESKDSELENETASQPVPDSEGTTTSALVLAGSSVAAAPLGTEKAGYPCGNSQCPSRDEIIDEPTDALSKEQGQIQGAPSVNFPFPESEQALEQANQLLNKSPHNQAQAPTSSSATSSSVAVAPVSFSNAEDASIPINDDAIPRANGISGQSSTRNTQAQASFSSSVPALFSTAGGGSIKISDDAIANANRMFGESSGSVATDEQAQAVASASAGASGPALFSTAGGGSIKVSDDAIANANRMFGESSSAAATDEQAQATPSVPTGASGPALFSMAGGGSIKISDDAIANANRMFGESSSAAATDEQAQAVASLPLLVLQVLLCSRRREVDR